MVALKGSEIDAFVRKPPDRAAVVLVYGPDEGLVAERGRALAKAGAGGTDDPFSLIRLDGSDLTGDAARLVDEATTISMFGARRVVWVRDPGRADLAGAVAPLFKAPLKDTLVVIEAGDLKRTAPLRKLVEDHPAGFAIPCYPDETPALARLIDDEVKRAGLTIEPAAREALEALIGADRLASRGEVQKLCLYAHGRGGITEADVAAIVGDASAFAMDELVDAVAGGDPSTADQVLGRMVASGTPASVCGGQVIRHFQTLQRLRAEIDGGQSAASAVEALRPPAHFRRKPLLARQLGLWSAARIDRALGLLDTAMLQSRVKPLLATAVLSEAFLQIARAARVRR